MSVRNLTDELLQHRCHVRILDNLSPRVHGAGRKRPEYIDRRADLIVVGDIGGAHMVREALDGVDAVFHLATPVGLRQSMYQIEKYMSTNTLRNRGAARIADQNPRQTADRRLELQHLRRRAVLLVQRHGCTPPSSECLHS